MTEAEFEMDQEPFNNKFKEFTRQAAQVIDKEINAAITHVIGEFDVESIGKRMAMEDKQPWMTISLDGKQLISYRFAREAPVNGHMKTKMEMNVVFKRHYLDEAISHD